MQRRTVQAGNHMFSIEYPDKCSVCHYYGDINFLGAGAGVRNSKLEVIFQCPVPKCQSHFIGIYGEHGTVFEKFIPSIPEPMVFPDIISEISSGFLEIYTQANEAMHIGLNQIAGPGFRKAFEFLIKDYAKSISETEKHSSIESATASQVINDYISDNQIQAVASRALWVGNDETHYLRKWEHHDIKDLLNLIRLTVNRIENEHLSKEYVQTMPDPRNKVGIK